MCSSADGARSRRGSGDEIAGTRPYRPGDRSRHPLGRVGAALRGARDRRVRRARVLRRAGAARRARADRRPRWRFTREPSPWLDKRGRGGDRGAAIAASAAAEHGDSSRVDDTGIGPRSERGVTTRTDDAVALGLSALLRRPGPAAERQLRLRRLRLHHGRCRPSLAAAALVRMGRRAGDRPGPRLGADVPRGQRRRPARRRPRDRTCGGRLGQRARGARPEARQRASTRRAARTLPPVVVRPGARRHQRAVRDRPRSGAGQTVASASRRCSGEALATCVLLRRARARGAGRIAAGAASTEPRSVGLGDAFRYTVDARGPHGPRITVLADSGPFLVVAAPRTTRSAGRHRYGARRADADVPRPWLCADRRRTPRLAARRARDAGRGDRDRAGAAAHGRPARAESGRQGLARGVPARRRRRSRLDPRRARAAPGRGCPRVRAARGGARRARAPSPAGGRRPLRRRRRARARTPPAARVGRPAGAGPAARRRPRVARGRRARRRHGGRRRNAARVGAARAGGRRTSASSPRRSRPRSEAGDERDRAGRLPRAWPIRHIARRSSPSSCARSRCCSPRAAFLVAPRRASAAERCCRTERRGSSSSTSRRASRGTPTRDRDDAEPATRDGGRAGLILFSDTAYQALPPGTPVTELGSFERFFRIARPTSPGLQPQPPRSPWTSSFSAGTRISTGLSLALDVAAGGPGAQARRAARQRPR